MNVIQLGCNNCEDHVLELVKVKSHEIQNLILVDALPTCVEIAKRQYSFLLEKLIVINAAIGTENGLIDIFYPNVDDKSIHASFDPNHLFAHGHEKLTKIKVPSLNINNFFKSLNLEKIDYLFVDMEGMDVITLLEMDFEKYDPTFLRYEHKHSEGPNKTGGQNHLKLLEKLRKFNYSLSSDDVDTVAKKD